MILNNTQRAILAKYAAYIKKSGGKKFSIKILVRERILTRHEIEFHFRGLQHLEKCAAKLYPDLFSKEEFDIRDRDYAKKVVAKRYVEIREKLGRTPRRIELEQMRDPVVTKHRVLNHFGTVPNLEAYARKVFPDLFKDKPIRNLINSKALKELRADVKKYKKFFITTAVIGTRVDEQFYKSVKQFCEINNAKLLILLCSDPAKSKEAMDDLGVLDPILANETIIFEDTKLNSNLHLSTIKLSAKAINPLTGLDRIGKKRGSFIYAAPKFFLKYTSVRNNKHGWPHALMTTGAITKPEYRSEYYMSQRTAYIAEFDHRLGGIFVEIENDEIYHFRQIQCLNKVGKFYFEDKLYQPDEKPQKIRSEGFIMGDLHVGATCPLTKKAWVEMIKVCKPKRIFLHDAFNGASVNGHIEKDIVEKYKRAMEGNDSLIKELELFAKELKFWASMVEEVIMVPSNHNDWIERYLREGRYAKDAINHYTGVCLAKGFLEGHNPLKYAVEVMFGIKLKNVVWLGRNDDYFIADTQLNCHGDVGVNGSRGTLNGMEAAYSESMSGHGHTAAIIRDTFRVGTSTFLQESYNNGAGTWTNTSGFIYEDGSKSLYNSIAGKWRT